MVSRHRQAQKALSTETCIPGCVQQVLQAARRGTPEAKKRKKKTKIKNPHVANTAKQGLAIPPLAAAHLYHSRQITNTNYQYTFHGDQSVHGGTRSKLKIKGTACIHYIQNTFLITLVHNNFASCWHLVGIRMQIPICFDADSGTLGPNAPRLLVLEGIADTASGIFACCNLLSMPPVHGDIIVGVSAVAEVCGPCLAFRKQQTCCFEFQRQNHSTYLCSDAPAEVHVRGQASIVCKCRSNCCCLSIVRSSMSS